MKRGKNLIGLGIVVILGLSLILIPVASRLSPVQAAVTWTKSGVNPVFIDGVVSGAACVIYDSDVGIYKMWYTHATPDLDKFDGLMDDILGLDLGTLIDDIRNLDFRAIADNDAANLKNIIDYLEGLTVAEIEALLVGTGSIISYATSPDGINWTPDTANNPVLEGTAGAWDKYYVGAPSVIKDDTGPDPQKRYKMWYTGGTMDLSAVEALLDDLADLTVANISTLLGDIVDLDIGAFITHVRADPGDAYLLDLIVDLIDVINGAGVAIGHATSPDGIDWTKDVANPVLEGTAGTWDRYGVGAPCVIKTGANEYEMWYTGYEVDYGALLGLLDAENISDIETALINGTNSAIGHARSANGVNWTPDANPVLEKGAGDVWDKYGVSTPWVIRHSSTNYEMWYTGAKMVPDTLLNFLRGTSDLETALINGTNSAIGHARSTNGVNWTPDANAVLSKGPGDAWDRYGVGAPCVIKMGNTYKMWYTGAKSYLSTFILDILGGSDLAPALDSSNTRVAIGYASYTVPPPEEPTAPPPPTIETNLFGIEASFRISSTGEILETIEATSEDGMLTMTIPEGTIALLEDKPLSTLTAAIDPSPPEPPEGTYLIEAYDFGSDGATFDLPITLTWSYDPETLPDEDVDLAIAYYDEINEEWVWVPCEVDTENNIITASVAHFTTFAIIAVPVELPPVVIPPVPAAFSVSYLSVSPRLEVEPGETVTITVLVANTGGESGSYTVVLKIDGVKEAEERVTIAAGESLDVSFSVTREEAGTYSVDVSGLTGSFTVREEVIPPVVPLVPAAFAISDLSITPAEVGIGETVTISTLVTNIGDLTGTYEVTLKIDDVVVATKEVTLAGGASQRITFTIVKNVAVIYTVNVDGLLGTFVVKTPPLNWWLIGGIIAGVIIIGVVVWQVIVRRRA